MPSKSDGTTTPTSSAAGRSTSGNGVAAAPRRGGLTIADKVVERTAGQILKDLPGVGGTSSGLFGIGASSSLETRPSVDVTLSGRSCTLAVEVGLSYPTPIAEATEQVRTTLSTEIERLTGVTVRQVDVDVRWLRSSVGGSDRGKRSLQ
ncbi:Asp23/Gls24 family envelope stress response protein [Brevibacterium spongiae]|uniref:Asp23/Gls24 family envelope stress response protein n=1 Tax=Brevibacterium spongiae TaxID=2909672 RepID=A0ABY5SRR4_9MICO|nr:Asp23/Gls24 family envelope stress response protein [Brevibacterium spongiae]UVI35806.1 Asp23/Gls24 family envelope stress response protein [Brevibacterium spongiae]